MNFKLDSFDAPPQIITALWMELSKAAEEISVNRLTIDLSNNGGGEVQTGFQLARLMSQKFRVKCLTTNMILFTISPCLYG